jgi:pseudouridine synthase
VSKASRGGQEAAPDKAPSPSPAQERVSRFLAGAGIASRRHADELIEQKRVRINGRVATLGEKVTPGVDKVEVDGREVGVQEPPVYIVLNKPPGYLSTCSDPFNRDTILSLLSGVPERVFPVGRLDLDADGLILLTNDGELAYLLTHPKHHVVKEYLVEVLGEKIVAKIKQILSGIIIDGKKVEVDYAKLLEPKRPHGAAVRGSDKKRTPVAAVAGAVLGPPRILIGVHEGEKHLVKNLCREVGLRVRRLTRTRMGPLRLGDLAQGKWRYLKSDEVKALYADALRVGEGEHNAER